MKQKAFGRVFSQSSMFGVWQISATSLTYYLLDAQICRQRACFIGRSKAMTDTARLRLLPHSLQSKTRIVLPKQEDKWTLGTSSLGRPTGGRSTETKQPRGND